MPTEESSDNANISLTARDNPHSDASIILKMDIPPPSVTTAYKASNSLHGVTTTPANGEDLVNIPPSFMNQIWKTLAKINAFIEKLQENQTST